MNHNNHTRFLREQTDAQAARLSARVWERATQGDGYQPFGYDRITMEITKPGWMRAIDEVDDDFRRRLAECPAIAPTP